MTCNLNRRTLTHVLIAKSYSLIFHRYIYVLFVDWNVWGVRTWACVCYDYYVHNVERAFTSMLPHNITTYSWIRTCRVDIMYMYQILRNSQFFKQAFQLVSYCQQPALLQNQDLPHSTYHMGRAKRKHVFGHMRIAKAQTTRKRSLFRAFDVR